MVKRWWIGGMLMGLSLGLVVNSGAQLAKAELEQEGQRLLAQKYIKCGDDYFTKFQPMVTVSMPKGPHSWAILSPAPRSWRRIASTTTSRSHGSARPSTSSTATSSTRSVRVGPPCPT